MPRYFDLETARQALPEVRRLLGQAVQARRESAGSAEAMAGILSHIQLSAGLRLDVERAGALKRGGARAEQAMRAAMLALREIGVQVKDLEVGLADFPTIYRGEEVLLCWRLGEPEILFWHGLEEGFRGRKAIDADFLAHHRGDGAG